MVFVVGFFWWFLLGVFGSEIEGFVKGFVDSNIVKNMENVKLNVKQNC